MCPRCGRPFKPGDLVEPAIRKVKLLAVFSVLVILGALAMLIAGLLQFNPRKLSPEANDGFSAPVMALEFVQTPEQATAILGPDQAPNRRAMKTQIYIDFVWIACYLALYLAISYLLSRRACPRARYLALVAAVCGISAAAFDVKENLGMLHIVNHPEVTQSILSGLHISDAAITKWTLSVVTLALLAITFYGVHEKLDRIGKAFTIAAAVGFLGLWFKFLLGALLPIPLLIGLVMLAYYAWVHPRLFLEQRC
ncbi:MAG TPA: hypothetical protein VEW46_15150 [Pyrinomonadaceae bacterium]|nr:hypothetical protein [Pyrinomonadaceae bacterium]